MSILLAKNCNNSTVRHLVTVFVYYVSSFSEMKFNNNDSNIKKNESNDLLYNSRR